MINISTSGAGQAQRWADKTTDVRGEGARCEIDARRRAPAPRARRRRHARPATEYRHFIDNKVHFTSLSTGPAAHERRN